LIKVTLLLQSNSEEIEQTSFVQHYKRKVVKSKVTIQPLATKKIMADDSNEEETGSQQTRQSTRNEDPRESMRILCPAVLTQLSRDIAQYHAFVRVELKCSTQS
jgi:hypothetical protein